MPTNEHPVNTNPQLPEETEQDKPCGFVIVPLPILRTKHLTGSEKHMYAALISYWWDKSICWPSQYTLQQVLHIGNRQVRRLLKSLEKKALIQIIKRGQGETNMYRKLDWPKWLQDDR